MAIDFGAAADEKSSDEFQCVVEVERGIGLQIHRPCFGIIVDLYYVAGFYNHIIVYGGNLCRVPIPLFMPV